MSNQTQKFWWWADFLLPDGRTSRVYNPEAYLSRREAEVGMENATRFRHDYGGAVRVRHGINSAFCGSVYNTRAM